MPEEIYGKIFREPHEVENPLSEERKQKVLKAAAEFDRIRDSYPPDQLQHLPEKYGDDWLGTPKEAEYLAEVEERKKRGEYWGGPELPVINECGSIARHASGDESWCERGGLSGIRRRGRRRRRRPNCQG